MGEKEKIAAIVFFFICILLPLGMVRSPTEIGSHVLPLWGCYYGWAGYWLYTGKPFWQVVLACYGISSAGVIVLFWGTGLFQIIFTWLKKHFGIENIRNKNPIIEFQTAFQSLAEREEKNKREFALTILRCIWLGLKALVVFPIALVIYYLIWPIIMVFKNFKKWFSKLKFWNRKKKPIRKKNKINHRFARWLAKGNVWLILLVLFVPCPYTDPAATVAMKIKGTKYGLWYLLGVNLLHIAFIVFLVQQFGVKIFSFFSFLTF